MLHELRRVLHPFLMNQHVRTTLLLDVPLVAGAIGLGHPCR
ncbi:hypothetical protein ACFYQ5_31020 [Streptomyces sp. NPDC005794]